MENKDRVSEILSDNRGLEPEMLEKLSKSCSVLSDEQKNRIFDLIQAKENGTAQIIDETEKHEENIRIIEYRKKSNTIKIIAAAAACACLVSGLTIFSNKNDENINVGNNKATTTAVFETSETADISGEYVTSEQKPSVTVIETVLSAEEVSGTVKSAETASVTEAVTQSADSSAVTSAVSETEKAKELKNIKDAMMSKTWGEGGAYDTVTGAMREAGFNEEQIYIMKNTAMFTRFADEIESLNYEPGKETSHDGKTGFSYKSYLELIGLFFTDDARQILVNYDNTLMSRSPKENFRAADDNGELVIQCATPVRYGPDACEVIITEKTDSTVKFILRCKKIDTNYTAGINPDDNIDETLAAMNSSEETLKYFGPRFKGLEYSEEYGFLADFDYEEEMVKTADGWRFSVYSNFSLS